MQGSSRSLSQKWTLRSARMPPYRWSYMRVTGQWASCSMVAILSRMSTLFTRRHRGSVPGTNPLSSALLAALFNASKSVKMILARTSFSLLSGVTKSTCNILSCWTFRTVLSSEGLFTKSRGSTRTRANTCRTSRGTKRPTGNHSLVSNKHQSAHHSAHH